MSETTVVVTGANGFIASWIVKLLLESGRYTVRGTVRNPNDVTKLGHLLDLPGAKERLTLYKASLVEEGSFDESVNGADYVLHTATPVIVGEIDDPKTHIIDPSVEGTLNVLRSAAKTKTVKRVVYTSSTAAVYYSERFINRTEEDVVDESWWSDVDYCLREELYYHAGKTLAERAAFEFAKDASFDVVSILPSNVIGSMLQTGVNWSSNEILLMLKGINTSEKPLARIPNCVSFVDVEDVAMAHILAMGSPSAEGRYLCVERSMTDPQMTMFVVKHYPQYSAAVNSSIESKDEESFMNPIFKFTNQKLTNLGLHFTPITETVEKTVKCLQQMNML